MAPRGVCGVVFVSTVLLVVCQVCSVFSERIFGEDNDEFDFDGLPGANHEFKVHVPGHTEDCFFQPVGEGAQFYVTFEVLRGGDGVVDFYIRDEHWKNLDNQLDKQTGYYSLDKASAGTYAVCVNNPRYGSTTVYFFIATFVFQEWTDFQMEMAQVQVLARNFSSSIDYVWAAVSDMKKSQANSRFHVVKDWYLTQSNHYYVYVWSLAQCILVVASALTQVYTVRRLFRHVSVTPTMKPRA